MKAPDTGPSTQETLRGSKPGKQKDPPPILKPSPSRNPRRTSLHQREEGEELNKKPHDPNDRRPPGQGNRGLGPRPGCRGQTGGQETACFLLLRNAVLRPRHQLPPADPPTSPRTFHPSQEPRGRPAVPLGKMGTSCPVPSAPTTSPKRPKPGSCPQTCPSSLSQAAPGASGRRTGELDCWSSDMAPVWPLIPFLSPLMVILLLA